MILVAPIFVRLITGNFARAITLYPFVFVRNSRDAQDEVLLNHERIHLRQQREMWIIPFYYSYLWEYFCGRKAGLNHEDAYRQISFESEAYTHQHDPDYLNKRRSHAYQQYKA